MKYKVGDKVRLRDDLEIGEIYGSITFLEGMENVKDKILTIADCYSKEGSNFCKSVENTFWYSEEMFEEVIMTNFERVKQELRIDDVGAHPLCDAIHRIRKEIDCYGRSCEECRKWLEEEYVEPIALTEAEKIILKNLDSNYKYIARDKDGSLYIFNEKPTKEDEFWDTPSYYCRLEAFEHLFKFVQWEDTEPYEIAELLKE